MATVQVLEYATIIEIAYSDEIRSYADRNNIYAADLMTVILDDYAIEYENIDDDSIYFGDLDEAADALNILSEIRLDELEHYKDLTIHHYGTTPTWTFF